MRKRDLFRALSDRTLRVAVLAGGPGSEREVSRRSGTAAHASLAAAGFPADLVLIDAALPEPFPWDVAFLALHGSFGEDGTIQLLLEERGIPYTGSPSDASRNAFDKILAKSLFVHHAVPTPGFTTVGKGDDAFARRSAASEVGFPMVVKPSREGSSVGISIVRAREELDAAFDLAFRSDARVLCEEFIRGREMTVGILEGRALPIVEMIPKREFFDFDAKYVDTGTEYRVNPDLPEIVSRAVQSAALAAHRALRCEHFSRVDVMYSEKRGPMVLEVNTLPGLTERSLLPKAAGAAGVGYGELCERMVRLGLERAAARRGAKKAARG
ncbi:MAG: D-alanine--D-alanine ligase [Candidatus Brocadiae bacterium]|nr:D-alanine--D-alanine ligase [Candidatus Brocadiia bacterium]